MPNPAAINNQLCVFCCRPSPIRSDCQIIDLQIIYPCSYWQPHSSKNRTKRQHLTVQSKTCSSVSVFRVLGVTQSRQWFIGFSVSVSPKFRSTILPQIRLTPFFPRNIKSTWSLSVARWSCLHQSRSSTRPATSAPS